MPESPCTKSWKLMVWVSSQLCVPRVGSLKLAVVGIYTSWKLANTVNQTFSRLLRAGCYLHITAYAYHLWVRPGQSKQFSNHLLLVSFPSFPEWPTDSCNLTYPKLNALSFSPNLLPLLYFSFHWTIYHHIPVIYTLKIYLNISCH